MKRLLAFSFVAASLSACAAVTNVVDVAALAAAVDAGLSKTNGWTLSGLGKYADDSSLLFNAQADSLVSVDYGAPILAVRAYVRCSSTSPLRMMCVFDDRTGAEVGRFDACATAAAKEWQTVRLAGDPVATRIRLQTTSGSSGNWGVGALSVITADPVVAPSALAVVRTNATACVLKWVNGANTVSNRLDTFRVEKGAGEAVLLATDFDSFDATGKGNPVPSTGKLPEIDPALSGVNVYAPANTSGICQTGTTRELGIVRHAGLADYSGVTLSLVAKRYSGDNAQTIVAYERTNGGTNAVATLVLTDEFADYAVNLSSVPGGAAILIGYYTTKSNRRVLIDSLSIVRTAADRETCIDSRFIPAAPGPMRFSTKRQVDLAPSADYRFEVCAQNGDGILSAAISTGAWLPPNDPGVMIMLQ